MYHTYISGVKLGVCIYISGIKLGMITWPNFMHVCMCIYIRDKAGRSAHDDIIFFYTIITSGIKLGDQQMITSGLVSALLFLVMSHSKPLNTLAPARPPPSICCVYMVCASSKVKKTKKTPKYVPPLKYNTSLYRNIVAVCLYREI